MSTQPGARLRAWFRRHRSDVLLAGIVLLVALPVMEPLMAQQASRYALTAALWDQRTVVLDDHAHLLSVDRAERGGHTYSDKAPGQPVLALPAYGVYRLAGGAPASQSRALARRDLGLWVVSVWSSALPAALLAVAMRHLALRVSSRRATAAALGLALGTMLLPFATVLFAHVLSALVGVGAYLLLTREAATPAHIAGAGLLAGAAVTVEYTMGLLVLILAIVAVLEHRWASVWYALGGVVPAVLLGLYHAVAFGGPFEPGYRYSRFAAVHEQGVVGVGPPRLPVLAEVLAGERGLLVLTPLVAVGLAGLVWVAWRRGGAVRRDAVVALVVLTAFVALMAGWSNPTGGASPGPRYVVPALPFLAAGVAWMWQRLPSVTVAAAAFGTITMALGTFTLPLAQPTEHSALLHWVERMRDGRRADTLLTGALGDWAILLPLVAAAVVGLLLVRAEARERSAARRPTRSP